MGAHLVGSGLDLEGIGEAWCGGDGIVGRCEDGKGGVDVAELASRCGGPLQHRRWESGPWAGPFVSL